MCKSISSKEVIKELKKIGFVPVKQKGSHLKMINGNKTIVIPNSKKDISYYLIQREFKREKVKIAL